MAWVTWRQHRFALAGAAALLGVLGVYLWLAGPGMHRAYTIAADCRPADSLACINTVGDFNAAYGTNAQTIAAPLHAVPALIGAFVGAPVRPVSWRRAPSGMPGRRASAGGAGRSPSWCSSRSR